VEALQNHQRVHTPPARQDRAVRRLCPSRLPLPTGGFPAIPPLSSNDRMVAIFPTSVSGHAEDCPRPGNRFSRKVSENGTGLISSGEPRKDGKLSVGIVYADCL